MPLLIWTEQATDDLADVWMRADDPNAVTVAIHRAERALAADPFRTARHVREGLWRLDVPPLAVFFETDDGRQVVRLEQISLLGPAPPT